MKGTFNSFIITTLDSLSLFGSYELHGVTERYFQNLLKHTRKEKVAQLTVYIKRETIPSSIKSSVKCSTPRTTP